MLHRFAALVLVVSLAGCASGPRRPDAQSNGIGLLGSIAPFLTSGRPALTDAQSIDPSNVTVRGATDPGASDDPAAEPRGSGVGQAAGGNYTLNFVNAEIQEFVRSVFDEVLRESVVVAPTLQGRVTVRTQNPVSKAVALDLVREALQVSGASLSRTGQVWRVGAIGSGPGAQPGGGRPRETIRVIPLRYVDSNEARQALQSLAAAGSDITISGTGRFVILAGRSADVDAMDQMLSSLDVDQLRGQAFSLVPLKQAGASAVSRDLNSMFGGGEGGGVRAMPIERMNAVLITTRNRAAMARARAWITNLDQAGRGDRRVHIYPVRNRRAGDLAKVLDGMFRGRSSSARGSSDGGVAPSLTQQRASTGTAGAPVRVASADGAVPQDAQSGANGGSGGDERSDAIEIRADLSTNSLVVVSRPEDYRAVEAAIRSLDVVPTQVLIEATIAEVRLNDAVRGGVRWFFQKGNHGFSLTDNASGAVGPSNPGFNYSFGVANARIVLSALESVTDVEVISSPALTVLDNQSATLKVGDQVPIATRSARSVTNPDAPIVNDIQLKDTGIILSVTPRVNSGGLVMLDIVQEASDVVPTTTSGIDSPTIRQRQVTSSVAVESGAEIVLGGIITRREEKGKSGIPLLKDIPILGAAFTSNNQLERGRTELLIILRPTIMSNSHEIRAVTEEIKARMNAASTGIYRGERSRGAPPPVVK